MAISQLRDELKAGFSEVTKELKRSRKSSTIQLKKISAQISNFQLGLGDGRERLSTQWLRPALAERGYSNANLEFGKKIRDPPRLVHPKST